MHILCGLGDSDYDSWLPIAKQKNSLLPQPPPTTHPPKKKKKAGKPHSETPKLHTLCHGDPCPNRRQAQTPSQRVWLLLVSFGQLGDLGMGLANTNQAQLAKETWRFQLPSGQIWAGSLQRVNHRAARASFTNSQAACVCHPTYC